MSKKTQVFFTGQLFFFRAEGLLLQADAFDLALPPTHEVEKAVDGRQHGVYGAHGVVLLHAVLFVGDH